MKKTLITLVVLWMLSTSLFADCIFYKPVEIKEVQIGNIISWSTLTESGLRTFIIEKSIDGVSFNAIGETSAAGTSDEVQIYQFLDMKMGVDEAYYRLRMVSLDEYSSYTHTIFFQRANSNDYAFKSMSSPFTDVHFTLLIESNLKGNMKYAVLNQKREVQLEKELIIVPGENMISVNFTDFKFGTYILQTVMNEEVEEVVVRKVHPESLPNVQYVIK